MTSRVLALVIVSLCGLACSDPPAEPEDAVATTRNVVLVTLDTLRADHLGVYGGDVATPHLDNLAAEGAVVRQASAHVPLTRPSHVALMSGRLPTETGVRDNVSPTRIPDFPLLAEVLEGAGFDTAAFVSSVVVSRASGLARGFGVYSDDFDADPQDPRFLNTAQKRGDETVAEAVGWLEEWANAARTRGEEDFEPRFFLWLHLFDPHDPYEPPEPYASRYASRPYAGEVAWTDELVGRLDAALERLGLAEATLLAVTSDHGEGLGDHDELLHGFFVYESTLHVPLILRGPGIRPGVVLSRPVGLVDLYPTILDALRIIPPSGTELSGRSLAAALAGGEEPPLAPVYAESLVPRLRFGWSELRSVRQGELKYIRAPRPELYNLSGDPGELADLARDERRSVRDLDVALRSFLERERTAEASEELPPELLEKLHALGYLGGSAPASTSTPGADPKDKVEEFRLANDLMRRGLERLHAADFRGARETFAKLLERGIDSAELHLYLGRALLGLREFDEAVSHLEEAAGRSPTHAGGWLGLAEGCVQLGDTEAALEALRAGQSAIPSHVGLRKEQARLLGMLGRYDAARQVLETTLELDSEDAMLHAMLSEALRNQGDLDGAVARLQEAVRITPEQASYWNALGMTLGGLERYVEAESAFREASRLDASNHRYAYNLGLVLVRLGRSEEARPVFESVLELDPDFEPARQMLAQ